ncbi:hypothetical protein A8135_06395 [Legionella jamestowniensis]|uniref:EPTP domain protein n=1 Tax=Legionella jamestowniensis TaxID=455 RepID=A0ABX2XQ97_9GAMM|nr:hypothetical protein [Legionella jamestowniensis]OCH96782.1 hypothetical protein A8135_06395 [Legionella jamestowniensis]
MHLEEYQRLSTSGARGIELFKVDGTLYLAIPQLAEDIPHKPANMNGGNSDTQVLIYRWQETQFKLFQSLPSHGSEDVHFFSLDEKPLIAVANIRSGQDPDFNMYTDSAVYEWVDNKFTLLQKLPSFAAKGCHFFENDEECFLLLSEGVSLSPSKIIEANSHMYRWNGHAFEAYQALPGLWGYNIDSACIDNRLFVSLADNSVNSVIYEWKNKQLFPFQAFAKNGGGRQIKFFMLNKTPCIAVANLLYESEIYFWNGKRYEPLQTLPGAGCRNIHVMNVDSEFYLFRINFITGTRERPKIKQKASVYRWAGNQFEEEIQFMTLGGTACQSFQDGKDYYLVVSNSLNEKIRFRVDSIVFKLHF